MFTGWCSPHRPQTLRSCTLGFLLTDSFMVKPKGTASLCDCLLGLCSEPEQGAAVVHCDRVVGRVVPSQMRAESSPLTPSPHMGCRQSASAACQPRRTCCVHPSPRLFSSPLVETDRRKQPKTERGLLSRRETRDTWELTGVPCEAGWTPGQPWGLPDRLERDRELALGTLAAFREGVADTASSSLGCARVPLKPRPA